MNNNLKSRIHTSISEENDYQYSVSNNEVTIVKYLGSDSNVIIPEEIEGYPVTIVGSAAFINNTKLTNITLSNASVVEDKAFSGCIGLTTVVGDNVTIIGAYVFYNCMSLESISIPKVEALDIYCFSNCKELESINISLVTMLPDNIFSNCYKLKNVNIEKVQIIAKFSFENCTELEDLSAPEAISVGYGAFCYSGIKSFNLPKVEIVGYDAFIECERLEDVSLPEAVEIGDNVFLNSGIGSIELPLISTLGNKVFSFCRNLKCVCLSKELAEVGKDVFSNSPAKGLTIDYGQEDISGKTEEDWYSFASKLSGFDVDSVIGRYIKNHIETLNFTEDDTEAPVITLIGESQMTLEVGLSTYVEQGAIVTDNSCEEIVPVISGSVNTNKYGHYTVSYIATDTYGNSSTVNRTVNVVDTTAPVITLIGPNPITLEVEQGSSTYIEYGCTITDNSGAVLSPVIYGVPDTSKIGKYTILYSACDPYDNKSQVTRSVNVVDTTAPVIVLNESNPMSLELNISTYNEPGATIIDNSGEAIIPVIEGSVDTSKLGQYVITYNATDSSGNKGIEVKRIVNVEDNTPPVITLVGSNPMNIEVGTPYMEPGADVTDNSGESIVPIVDGRPNDTAIGVYYVNYNATDSHGNKAKTVTRTVNVNRSSTITCSQLVGYCNIQRVVAWELYSLDNVLLYKSGNYSLLEEWHFNIDTLSLEEGTMFYIKLMLEGTDDITGPMHIQYQSRSYTSYFDVDFSGTEIEYIGTVYSHSSPPLIQCDKIDCYSEHVDAEFRWEVRTLEDKLVYASSFDGETTYRRIDLNELPIEVGTVVTVKAYLVVGDDSTVYLNFKYMPGSTSIPKITLYGTGFKTCIMYTG